MSNLMNTLSTKTLPASNTKLKWFSTCVWHAVSCVYLFPCTLRCPFLNHLRWNVNICTVILGSLSRIFLSISRSDPNYSLICSLAIGTNFKLLATTGFELMYSDITSYLSTPSTQGWNERERERENSKKRVWHSEDAVRKPHWLWYLDISTDLEIRSVGGFRNRTQLIGSCPLVTFRIFLVWDELEAWTCLSTTCWIRK